MDLSRFQQQINSATASDVQSLPPVEKWDPPFCGDLNMQIHLDGRWFYEGTPIGRAALVRLFSTVLKKEAENYYLVTPVEKVGLTVEDVPFVFVTWHRDGETIVLETQTGDTVQLNNTDQLELRLPPDALSDAQASPIPYVNVRRNLWGRLHHNVYYQLIDEASSETDDAGNTMLALNSGGKRFVLGTLPAG